jgi:hypothetical protein
MIEDLQQMARCYFGSIFYSDATTRLFVDGRNVLSIVDPDDETKFASHGIGPDQEQTADRFQRLCAFVEGHPQKDEGPIVITVTSWPDRADDVAQWIVNNFPGDEPVTHIKLTPNALDRAFDMPRSFSAGMGDGNRRGMASIFGITDHQ